MKRSIKYSVYLCEFTAKKNSFIQSLFWKSKTYSSFGVNFVISQLYGNNNISILFFLFSCLLQWQMKHSIQIARTSDEWKNNSLFNFSVAFIVLHATHFHVNQHISHSCFPLSVFEFRIPQKSSSIRPFRAPPFHSPLAFCHSRFVCPFCSSTHCRLCDYYYNYLRLSYSFTMELRSYPVSTHQLLDTHTLSPTFTPLHFTRQN